MAKDYSNIEGLIGNVKESIRNAYEKGYKQGYNEGTASHDGERGSIYYGGYGDGHKDGLNDAWECARKIALRKDEARNAFHDIAPVKVFEEYSASEAIDKIKEYEDKQKKANNEIKVGDEVMDGEVFNSGKGIIVFISSALIYVLWHDGSTGRRKLEDIKKTGRHFDQIAEVLKQLKEEENG